LPTSTWFQRLRRSPRRLQNILVNAYWWLRNVPDNAAAYAANWRGARRYRRLSEAELKATRTSDTVFIFGCGYSINDITPAEWAAIARHNTISFNAFPRQNFVRADYHVFGEFYPLEELAERMRTSPLYARTTLILQEGWRALSSNLLVGRGLLRPDGRVFRYRRIARGKVVPPSRSLARGLVHGPGSIVGVTNFAYLMGWKTIVLAGIDLYDRRYFWLGPEETLWFERPGMTHQSKFTQSDAIVGQLGQWRALLAAEGVELTVFNPRSLLAKELPVYDRRRLLDEGMSTHKPIDTPLGG
jgi:hypothetical protein